MSATGYIQVHAYASRAQLPLENVSVAVTASDGTALALRLTDRSGRITPVEVPTPDPDESQSPDAGQTPFTAVTLHARLQGYEQVQARDVQVFADTVTLQELELIPLAELPEQWDRTEDFQTPPQNL